MSDINLISYNELFHFIGTANCPIVIDARIDEDFDIDPWLIPSAFRRPGLEATKWVEEFCGHNVVVYCDRGLKISQACAAWLNHYGANARVLEGGFQGWKSNGFPLIPQERIPTRNHKGQTVWVTRTRPKIDRIACPWLIRRFVDPNAVFLFVYPSEVAAVAERFKATPFDIDAVFWSHRGDMCSFDIMIDEFGLKTDALLRLASIVRGADTARFDLAPEAAGLLAASLGLSQMFDDDLKQLDAGMLLYDAYYRWARDAADETHNWPAKKAQ